MVEHESTTRYDLVEAFGYSLGYIHLRLKDMVKKKLIKANNSVTPHDRKVYYTLAPAGCKLFEESDYYRE
jgi:DNA-binding MarR family transcriptional regulator